MLRQHLYGLVWALFILILCGMPGQDIPHISFLELLSFDKFVHAAIFFIQVVLLINGFQKNHSSAFLNKNAVIVSLALSITYGGLLEIMQGALFENRSADIYDFIANSFGCFCGALYKLKVRRKA